MNNEENEKNIFIPAYIAQISEAIREFNKTMEKSSIAAERLSQSIIYLTLAGTIVSVLTLIWSLVKFFIKQ
ncbi:MAG: hypothetical protein BWY53_00392 [Parcubacteria group bacterium ADurb.Bin326]|nr:MAG: hypothetical protein BWY53_00392 [Parcubacteria group bacterium ADurb.Bin326]